MAMLNNQMVHMAYNGLFWDIFGIYLGDGLPSGYVKIAIENGHRIVDLAGYKMVISHSYVSLPEGILGLQFSIGHNWDSFCEIFGTYLGRTLKNLEKLYYDLWSAYVNISIVFS